EPVRFTYDHGLLMAITRGSGPDERSTLLAYDSRGLLQAITDAMGQVTTYVRDAAGRIASIALPGSRTVQYTYDDNGNIRTVTPPGRPPHEFSYTAVDLISGYAPPQLADVPAPSTTYTYDLDRNLTATRRPDGLQVDYHHNLTSRL